jgi:hypothetical protein
MNRILLISLFAFLLADCNAPKSAATKAPAAVWVNKEKIQGKTFHKVFIVVMTADIEARNRLENDLAAVAVSKGYEAVKSLELLPMSLDNPRKPTKDEVVGKVKESGADAVFVGTLLRKDEAIRYVPGTRAYSMTPYYSWSGSYYGYYNNYYESVSQPAYYDHDKQFFMQSNLYDAASEELMWSVQSSVFNPADLPKFSKDYTETLLKELEKIKLMRKEK